MSTNFYVYTPDGEEIHLGKRSGGWTFLFRGYPEKGIDNYEAWRNLLDLGEIRDECGAPLTAEEMEAVVAGLRSNARTEPQRLYSGQVRDLAGNRFSLHEFC